MSSAILEIQQTLKLGNPTRLDERAFAQHVSRAVLAVQLSSVDEVDAWSPLIGGLDAIDVIAAPMSLSEGPREYGQGDAEWAAAPSDFKQIYRSLRSTDKGLSLALQRFSTPTLGGRSNAILDYWIGLEAILLEGIRAELKYRASLRLAYLLSDSPEGRQLIAQRARKSYDIRSQVAHGEAVNIGTLADETRNARELLRAAIVELLLRPAEAKRLEDLIFGFPCSPRAEG